MKILRLSLACFVVTAGAFAAAFDHVVLPALERFAPDRNVAIIETSSGLPVEFALASAHLEQPRPLLTPRQSSRSRKAMLRSAAPRR